MKEYSLKTDSMDSIAEAIITLNDHWSPIVIRDECFVVDKEGWYKFLINTCKLFPDTRHFDFHSDLSISQWWEISNQPDKATSYAYSNTPQPLHTDNAWFSDPSEINFFYMARQAESGGEQTIYRLDRLIEDLSKEEKALFEELTTRVVTIQKGEGEYFNETPIINLSGDPKIFWNYYRTKKTNPEVEIMCKRFFNFLKTKENSKVIQILQCNNGDAFCLNDLKALHGRRKFSTKAPRDRILYQSMWKQNL
jgi:hypothetical protein